MLETMLSHRGRRLFIRVVFFSAFASLVDAVSVSLMAPFLAVATDFSFIHTNPVTSNLFTFFSFQNEAAFVAALGITILAVYCFRAVISLLTAYLIARFSYGQYSHIAMRLFSGYLHYPFTQYTKRNTSDLTKAVMVEANQITQVFSGLLTIATELLVFILLYGIMLFTNWQGTLLITAVLGSVAFVLIRSVTEKTKQAGTQRVDAGGKMFRILSSAFGSFRMLKLQSAENAALTGFRQSCQDFSRHFTAIGTLHNIPRLGLELAGFGLLIFALTVYIGVQKTDIQALLPVFSLFAVALYRLMPSINRIATSWNQILAGAESLRVVYNELHQPMEELGDEDISFDQEIILENLGFAYEATCPVLQNVNLKIRKGERIAIVGESGHGKSTLLDLIIGLLPPTQGRITVDSTEITDENLRSWRRKIGYIPQTVYLFDGTVRENVVFGRQYDEAHLRRVLRQANIWHFLETKEGTETMVGDAGVMLSGGQCQRIAIARALYGNPEVLVLDEATSGLDIETERKILQEIRQIGAGTTVITVTHRRSSVDAGQIVYQLDSKNLCQLEV
ncbi:MAG: ABC transporter ATP-binding protein [Candidatus Electrothrix sp. YB6]